MNLKLIFTIAYFAVLLWTFKLGRTSVYDDWFNDIKWQKYYLSEDGTQMTEEEYLAKKEEEKKLVDSLTPEEQMVALLTILENTKEAINKIEAEYKGTKTKAKKIISEQFKNFKYQDDKLFK